MKEKIGLLILSYLKFFARIQLAKISLIQKLKGQTLIIIGITGSAGKSSTLNACQAALSPQFKIKTNQGYNSETGLPLSILGLKIKNYNFISWLIILILTPLKILINWKSYQVLLLEMGIDSPQNPKNMDFLLSIVKPDIGIFLNVSSVHMFNFSSLDQLAQEKAKLVNSAKTAIINDQDKLVKKYTNNKNTINIIPIKINFKKFFLPEIYKTNFGSAIILARLLNINYKKAIINIQNNFSLPPSRSSILKGIKDTTIIDSSYNSSPLACQKLLEFLSTFKTKKITILGDMRELGQTTSEEHKKLYQLALESADTIISVGPETNKYFGDAANKFTYWWQAAKFIKKQIKGTETILIKGSQNTIFLEELVKSILKNTSDSSKICRQSPYWLKVKNNFRQQNKS